MRLKDRVAVVTGSTKGIGRAIAKAFAREGAQLVVNGRDAQDLAAVKAELSQTGTKVLAKRADVRIASQVNSMFQAALEFFGRIDILVNNAGGSLYTPTPIEEITEEHWDLVVDTNLKGTFLCSKAVLEHMKSRKYGRIVNISSQAGRSTSEFSGPHYAAANAGILGFTRQLARQMGIYGITVNAVAPGFIMSTERVRKKWEGLPEARRKEILSAIPLEHRWGRLDELVGTVIFLASDEASYITGVSIDVNGGRYML
ncbi:MAG: 3-oxoacyl-ACP reductase family protein [Thermodesulfobacteriota bacterium]